MLFHHVFFQRQFIIVIKNYAKVGGVSEQQLLTQLTQLHLAVNKSNLSCIRQLAADGLDLGIPLRYLHKN